MGTGSSFVNNPNPNSETGDAEDEYGPELRALFNRFPDKVQNIATAHLEERTVFQLITYYMQLRRGRRAARFPNDQFRYEHECLIILHQIITSVSGRPGAWTDGRSKLELVRLLDVATRTLDRLLTTQANIPLTEHDGRFTGLVGYVRKDCENKLVHMLTSERAGLPTPIPALAEVPYRTQDTVENANRFMKTCDALAERIPPYVQVLALPETSNYTMHFRCVDWTVAHPNHPEKMRATFAFSADGRVFGMIKASEFAECKSLAECDGKVYDVLHRAFHEYVMCVVQHNEIYPWYQLGLMGSNEEGDSAKVIVVIYTAYPPHLNPGRVNGVDVSLNFDRKFVDSVAVNKRMVNRYPSSILLGGVVLLRANVAEEVGERDLFFPETMDMEFTVARFVHGR